MLTNARAPLAVLALLFAARAASPPAALGAALTLDECVQLALRNNIAVARAEGNLVSARAGVTSARSDFLPRLSMSAGWSKSETEAFLNPDIGLLISPPSESWSASGSANLTVFDGLGNVARLRQAGLSAGAQEELHKKALQDVVFETERLYFDLLKKEQLGIVRQEATRLSEEQLKKTRAMKELGASTQADVFKAEVEHSNNRLEALRAERDVEVARAALAAYLGLDPRESIEVREDPLDSGAGEAGSAASERALETHPSLIAARQGAEASRQSVRAAKSDRFPSVSLFGNLSYSDPNGLRSLNDERTQWNYGARLSYTLFDGLLTKANIRRAESDLVTSRRTVENAERDVLLGVRQAALDVEISEQSIVVAQEAVKSSEEDLRLAEERYKVGEGTILEVIDAQVNLTRAKTDRVNATFDHRVALAALRNAIGETPAPEIAE